MHITTHFNKVIILTDHEACYTVKIASCIGSVVYLGDVCSKKQRIVIYGLECGEYEISVAALHELYEKKVVIN